MTVEEVIEKLRRAEDGQGTSPRPRDSWLLKAICKFNARALTGAYHHTVERFHDSSTFVAQQLSL